MTNLFLNALIYLYDLLGHNLALAIIVLTIAVKFVLAWPSAHFIRSQKAMQALQPKLSALRTRYKNDREALAKATMELYRSNKVNPFSSCLPLIFQGVILIILYQVFLNSLKIDPATHLLAPEVLDRLYPSVRATVENQPIITALLPGLDLAKGNVVSVATVVLAIVTGALQFWQSRMLTAAQPPKVPGAQDESLAALTSRQMLYIFPVVTAFLVVRFPGGLGLYWATSTAFSIVQQWLVLRVTRQPSDEGVPRAPDASRS